MEKTKRKTLGMRRTDWGTPLYSLHQTYGSSKNLRIVRHHLYYSLYKPAGLKTLEGAIRPVWLSYATLRRHGTMAHASAETEEVTNSMTASQGPTMVRKPKCWDCGSIVQPSIILGWVYRHCHEQTLGVIELSFFLMGPPPHWHEFAFVGGQCVTFPHQRCQRLPSFPLASERCSGRESSVSSQRVCGRWRSPPLPSQWQCLQERKAHSSKGTLE